MLQAAKIEIDAKPNALLELYELLYSPVPIYVTSEQLLQKGFSTDETQAILRIITDTNTTKQKLINYSQEHTKQLIEQDFRFTLERNKLMKESGDGTMALIDKLKNSLIENATGTLSAYNNVISMYTIAFILGIALIITAIVFGAMNKTVLAIAFGTIGLIDIVAYFVKLPANKIQESRSNLSQLQMVLLVCMKELVNNDVMNAKVINTENPDITKYTALTNTSINTTASLLKLIEEMAEPKS
jgi:hypothetical protein